MSQDTLNPNALVQKMFESVMVEKFVKDVWEAASPKARQAFADAVIANAMKSADGYDARDRYLNALLGFVQETEAWAALRVKAAALVEEAVGPGWYAVAETIKTAIEQAVRPSTSWDSPLAALTKDIGEYARKRAAEVLGVR